MVKISRGENIFTITGALIFTAGFMQLFSTIFHDSISDSFILLTLPLIIGALLINKLQFETEGKIMLLSSVIMIIGILITFNLGDNFKTWYGLIVLNIGAFIFSYGLFRVFYSVMEDLIFIPLHKKFTTPYTQQILKKI